MRTLDAEVILQLCMILLYVINDSGPVACQACDQLSLQLDEVARLLGVEASNPADDFMRGT